MGRTISATNTTATSNIITDPYYLIELYFDTPLYLSTLYQVTVDAKEYSSSRLVKMGKIKPNANGSATTSITLGNADNAVSVLILAQNFAGSQAKVYKTYGTSPAVEDLELLFTGVMGKASIATDGVKLELSGESEYKQSPGLVIAKPWCNFLPPSGTVIKTSTLNITLNRAN